MKKLIGFLFVTVFALSCKDRAAIDKLEAETARLQGQVDSLTQVLNQKPPETNRWFDKDYDGRELKKSGISNPEEFIETSLRQTPEIIPMKAVLGGTMNFREIQVLSRKWVLADYDDGHIQGRGLFRYRINSQSKLEFELLDAVEHQ